MKPTITCSGPSAINQGDSAQIVATASNASGGSLRYSFTSSAGSLSPNGNTVGLTTAFVASGPLTVTCTATNDTNGSASATASIYINAVVGEQALTAFQFVDSVGVNVHLHYGNTPYYTAFPQVLASMKALGIHHYRNGIDPYANMTEYQNAETLAANGIKADWLIDRRDTAQNINAIYMHAPNSVEAFEGPNEDDVDAGPVMNRFMEVLHDTVRGNPATANTPIYAPTVLSIAGIGKMGDLSAYVDYSNMHDYYNPRFPETPAYGGFFYNCGAYGTIAFNACMAQQNAPNRPVVSTETGYISGKVPDTAIGRYMPRLLFSHLKHNVMRTYVYEFIDEVNSPNYGLVKEDFTPKPSYTAIKNLISLFQDQRFASPGKLGFTITGSTTHVQHVLFQKSDGTFLVALWLGVPSASGADTLSPAPQTVSLQTSTPTGNATLHILDDSGNMHSASGNTSDGSTTVSVTDRVTVVALPRQ